MNKATKKAMNKAMKKAMNMNTAWRTLFAGCVLVISGCGSDSPPPTAGIKLGLLLPFSGSLEGYGTSMKNAASMAVVEINAAGGVLKKNLELELVDEGTDQTKAVAGATALVGKGVIAIVGPVPSSSSIAVFNEVVKTARVPINVTGTSPLITGLQDDGLVWRCMPSDVFQAQVGANYAYDLLKQKNPSKTPAAAVIYLNNAWGAELSKAFRDNFVKKGGQVATESFVGYPEMTDEQIKQYTFEQEAKQALAKQPDMVYIASYSKDGAKLTFQLGKNIDPNSKPVLFGTDAVNSTDFLTNSDSSVILDMIGTVPAQAQTAPNFKLFTDNFRQKYGGAPEAYSDGAYDAVYLYAYAMERGKAATKEVFPANLRPVSLGPGKTINVAQFADAAAELRAGREINYEGASGPVDWDANGDPTSASYEIWKVVKDTAGLKFQAVDNVTIRNTH